MRSSVVAGGGVRLLSLTTVEVCSTHEGQLMAHRPLGKGASVTERHVWQGKGRGETRHIKGCHLITWRTASGGAIV